MFTANRNPHDVMLFDTFILSDLAMASKSFNCIGNNVAVSLLIPVGTFRTHQQGASKKLEDGLMSSCDDFISKLRYSIE